MQIPDKISWLVGMVIVLVSCGHKGFGPKEYQKAHIQAYQTQLADIAAQKQQLSADLDLLDTVLATGDNEQVVINHLQKLTNSIMDMNSGNQVYINNMINNQDSRDLILGMLGTIMSMANDNNTYGDEILEATEKKDYEAARASLRKFRSSLMGNMDLLETGVKKYLSLCGVEVDH